MRKHIEGIKNKDYLEPMLKMYDDIEEAMKAAPASTKFHHRDKGGLFRHTKEVMEIGLQIYDTLLADMRKRAITKDDVIIVTFTHDLEKLVKYRPMKEPTAYQFFEYNYDKVDVNDTAFIVSFVIKYGLELTEKHLNALTFSHGGWAKDRGKMMPLAVLLHAADLLSTNLYG